MGAKPTAQDTARAKQAAIDEAHDDAVAVSLIATAAGAAALPYGPAIALGSTMATGCGVSCHFKSPTRVPPFEVKPAPLPEADTEEVEYVEPVGSIPCPPSSGVLRERNKKKK